MHKYHIQVNVQFLYNIYINYKTQKQKNYRIAKTIEPIPGNSAILLKWYSSKQYKFWKYLSENLSCPQRLVIELSFEKFSRLWVWLWLADRLPRHSSVRMASLYSRRYPTA